MRPSGPWEEQRSVSVGQSIAVGLLVMSSVCLVGAGVLVMRPRTARRIAMWRYHDVCASLRGNPVRRLTRYAQLCGFSMCAAGVALMVAVPF